jgi:modulator of FtsH protease
MYDPSAWRDYFVMVGGGSAALTGLVFVAMTLHLDAIVNHPVHRHRARTILTGLTAVFLRCGLVLMGGQSRQAVAVELIGVLVVVEVILYRSTRGAFEAADRGVLLRAIGSFACLVTEQAGAVALFLGATWGLYVVGFGMMASFVFMVSGAWLLLVGVEASQSAGKVSEPGRAES